MEFLVHVHRNTTSVVLYRDRLVLVDGNLDVRAIACHRLVDGVVHGLVHKVMETFLTDIADIHGRTLAHSLKTLQHLNVTGGIVVLVYLIV